MTIRNEHAEATRGRLLQAARGLFAERGFAGTPLEELTSRAGVTKGALYHHFGSKEGLFRAVLEQVEQDTMATVGAAALAHASPLAAMRAAQRRYLELCRDPAVRQVVLVDAPSVLGLPAYRELAERYGFGLVRASVKAAMDAGELAPEPVEPLARLLLGALTEAALASAEAADEDLALSEYAAALDRLLDRLAVTGGTTVQGAPTPGRSVQ